MKDKKKIVIGVLCALVGIMAVGYAALAQQLNITGTASIDSTWKVEITNITERGIVGDATSKETPSYTATTANFSVGLTQPTDSITYDIEVSNEGTLAAKVDSIQVTMDENDAITYTMEGIEEGDKLGVNAKDTLSVTVAYNPEVTSQPSKTAKDITVAINYVQDLGTDSGTNVPSIAYETYSIGDQITFAGSNWYVIKNSTSEEDYVTLMKETVLTVAEMGDYAYKKTYTCSDVYVRYNMYGCTVVGETVAVESSYMPYYLSDACHSSGYNDYTDYDESGCEGHNDYEGSTVREMLENQYLPTLGADNLKEVEGYKIRLITLEELQTNLGCATELTSLERSAYYEFSQENTPTWVYQNIGEQSHYWTMSSTSGYSSSVWKVTSSKISYYTASHPLDITISSGVRPVINLLKSSI